MTEELNGTRIRGKIIAVKYSNGTIVRGCTAEHIRHWLTTNSDKTKDMEGYPDKKLVELIHEEMQNVTPHVTHVHKERQKMLGIKPKKRTSKVKSRRAVSAVATPKDIPQLVREFYQRFGGPDKTIEVIRAVESMDKLCKSLDMPQQLC